MLYCRVVHFASVCALLLEVASCAGRRRPFQVLPGNPSDLLRSPDLKDTPFPEVPGRYTPNGLGWIDLRRQMGLRVENAYFREGSPRHTVDEFIGTEAAEYGVAAKGALRLVHVESKVARPPADQSPVEGLLQEALARYRFHRFFYQIVFSKGKGQESGAVLLGAASEAELGVLTARLERDPDAVCGRAGGHCAVFPQLCSVSVQMEILVNGAPQRVPWGSVLARVVIRPKKVELMRLYSGRPAPVEIDANDPAALRLPLLPGDRLQWQ